LRKEKEAELFGEEVSKFEADLRVKPGGKGEKSFARGIGEG